MQYRGVSWVTDAGKATRRTLAAGTLLGIAAVGVPMAEAKGPLPSAPRRETVTVVVRVEEGTRAWRLFESVGARLAEGWDGHTLQVVVPVDSIDR